MINRYIVSFIILLSLFALLTSCGQILPGGKGRITDNLVKAKKNLIVAESLQDIERKNRFLDYAEREIKEAKSVSDDKKIMVSEVAAMYAYFYYVKGDLSEARSKIDVGLKTSKELFTQILEIRISIKQKGRSYVNIAVQKMEKIVKRDPDLPIAHLTLGDAYFLRSSFGLARKHYQRVMTLNSNYMTPAADRLEVLNEIESTGISVNMVQNILFSKAVKRDEAADILQRVYNIGKFLKFGRKDRGSLKDISKSLHKRSIEELWQKGFFTYISANKFDPLKTVTRSEAAMMIEDFIVINTGNKTLRKQFKADKESQIKGISLSDPYYNSFRLAFKYKIMNPSLDGSVNPKEPISGLETLVTMRKMIKKFAKKKKQG